jgi:hypothetical protein
MHDLSQGCVLVLPSRIPCATRRCGLRATRAAGEDAMTVDQFIEWLCKNTTPTDVIERVKFFNCEAEELEVNSFSNRDVEVGRNIYILERDR